MIEGAACRETIEFLLTRSRFTGDQMVDQIPNLGRESEMLAEIGLASMSDLFSNIPEGVRREDPCLLYTSDAADE